MPEMIPTPESSTVVEIGYDPALEELYVTFEGSGPYAYSNVPAFVWDEMKMASSKGQFVHARLRGAYLYRRL